MKEIEIVELLKRQIVGEIASLTLRDEAGTDDLLVPLVDVIKIIKAAKLPEIEGAEGDRFWADSVSDENPILCDVWNDNQELKTSALVTRRIFARIGRCIFTPYYKDNIGRTWNHAKPAKREEMEKFSSEISDAMLNARGHIE